MEELPEPLLHLILEQTHVDLGCEAAVNWGLPELVVTVCTEHHSEDFPVERPEVHIVRVVSVGRTARTEVRGSLRSACSI